MITFEPIDAPLGAFVHGFDAAAAADEPFIQSLASGLLEHSVLVFRGQEISSSALVALGRCFGELEILPEPDKRDPVHPEIFNLSNVRPDGEIVTFDEPQAVFLRGTQRWHTDSSFRPVPALCTMLYAVEVPPEGGATQFANMRMAYASLAPHQREQMAGLKLVHSYEYSRAQNPGEMDPMSAEEQAKYPPTEHRWVRRHPDGSESLYMGGHVSHIADHDEAEGRAWVAQVEADVITDEVVYEHRWRVNDLVVWDNRTTLHRLLPYDIANHRRIMRRITVAGTAVRTAETGQ